MEEELVAVLDEKDRLEERLGPATDQEALEHLVKSNPTSELADLWAGRDWMRWRGVRLSGNQRVLGLALSDRRISKLCQIMHQLSALELLHLDYNHIKVSLHIWQSQLRSGKRAESVFFPISECGSPHWSCQLCLVPRV